MDSELESLAGSSSDEESDNEWSDIEEEDEDVIDLEGFDDRPPPLVTKTLPSVSSSPSQSSSAAKDTNESNNNSNSKEKMWLQFKLHFVGKSNLLGQAV